MSTFQDRITAAFKEENLRRASVGESRLTITDLWKAAGRSSGAATHWFKGGNGADMDACLKIAPLMRVNPYWLFDESGHKEPVGIYDSSTPPARHVMEGGGKPYIHPDKTIATIVSMLEATDEVGRGIALHAVSTALEKLRPIKESAA